MATFSNVPRPGYIYDSTDNVWYPIGTGAHSHNDIPLSTVDAKGDLIAGTANDTVSRLAVGSNGQLLSADSTATTGLAWVAAPSGKIKQIVNSTTTTGTTVSTTYGDLTSMSVSITPTASTSTILIMWATNCRSSISGYDDAVPTAYFQFLRGATTLVTDQQTLMSSSSATGGNGRELIDVVGWNYIDSPATTSSTTYKFQGKRSNLGGTQSTSFGYGSYQTSLIAIEIGA